MLTFSNAFAQLYGDAICRSGSWAHNEEETVNQQSHHIPVLSDTARTQGLPSFCSLQLSFFILIDVIQQVP